MTPGQIKNIHIAKSKVGFSEAQYRIMLRNIAGVESSKLLTQASYEDCMALLEDHGYRQILDGQIMSPSYWREKVATRGTFANGRLIHKARELYDSHATHISYPLAQLVRRVSDSMTDYVEDLTPREANNLIEMLKAIVKRTTENTENTEISSSSSSVTSAPSVVANPEASR